MASSGPGRAQQPAFIGMYDGRLLARLMAPIGETVRHTAMPAGRLRLLPASRHMGLPARSKTAKDQLT